MEDEKEDAKYRLMERISELEAEIERLRSGQTVSRQVPYPISGDVKKYISRSKIYITIKSKLLLTAHTVDKEFHESIQKIFKIDAQTNFSQIKDLNNMEYQKGPIKKMERCKAKAATDYVNEPFPSSSCILDINRCALIFEDIASMLKALDLFKNKISYFQSGNIVAICRDKNGFKEYKHSKPDYADIKLNILIRGVKYNVVGEVQFMLRGMMNFKHSVHSLYSIIRRKEFVDDFIKILPHKNHPLIKLTNVDCDALCDLMVTHGWDAKQILMPLRGGTVISIIFQNLHSKEKEKAAIRCFKLLLNNVGKKLIRQQLIGQNSNCLGADAIYAMGHCEMTKLLFYEFPAFEKMLKSDEMSQKVCRLMLEMYPEPKQFKNVIELLEIDIKMVIQWVNNPTTGMLLTSIYAGHEDNVKYLLSLLPNKTARLKLLNSPANDKGVTVLMAILCTATATKTLLRSFKLDERVDLIETGNLIYYSLLLGKFQIQIPKVIIESINVLPLAGKKNAFYENQ
eukprot:370985_1